MICKSMLILIFCMCMFIFFMVEPVWLNNFPQCAHKVGISTCIFASWKGPEIGLFLIIQVIV